MCSFLDKNDLINSFCGTTSFSQFFNLYRQDFVLCIDFQSLEEVEGCYSELIVSDKKPPTGKSKKPDNSIGSSHENSQLNDSLLGSCMSVSYRLKSIRDW